MGFFCLFAAFLPRSIAFLFLPRHLVFSLPLRYGRALLDVAHPPTATEECEKGSFGTKKRVNLFNVSHLALDGDPRVAVAVVRRDVLHRQLAVLPRRRSRHGRARLLDGGLLRVGVEKVGDDCVPKREERGGRRRRGGLGRRCLFLSAPLSEDGAGRRTRGQRRDLAHDQEAVGAREKAQRGRERARAPRKRVRKIPGCDGVGARCRSNSQRETLSLFLSLNLDSSLSFSYLRVLYSLIVTRRQAIWHLIFLISTLN